MSDNGTTAKGIGRSSRMSAPPAEIESRAAPPRDKDVEAEYLSLRRSAGSDLFDEIIQRSPAFARTIAEQVAQIRSRGGRWSGVVEVKNGLPAGFERMHFWAFVSRPAEVAVQLKSVVTLTIGELAGRLGVDASSMTARLHHESWKTWHNFFLYYAGELDAANRPKHHSFEEIETLWREEWEERKLDVLRIMLGLGMGVGLKAQLDELAKAAGRSIEASFRTFVRGSRGAKSASDALARQTAAATKELAGPLIDEAVSRGVEAGRSTSNTGTSRETGPGLSMAELKQMKTLHEFMQRLMGRPGLSDTSVAAQLVGDLFEHPQHMNRVLPEYAPTDSSGTRHARIDGTLGGPKGRLVSLATFPSITHSPGNNVHSDVIKKLLHPLGRDAGRGGAFFGSWDRFWTQTMANLTKAGKIELDRPLTKEHRPENERRLAERVCTLLADDAYHQALRRDFLRELQQEVDAGGQGRIHKELRFLPPAVRERMGTGQGLIAYWKDRILLVRIDYVEMYRAGLASAKLKSRMFKTTLPKPRRRRR